MTSSGAQRSVPVKSGCECRELTDESLEARADDWKVIIDYPFDEGHGPRGRYFQDRDIPGEAEASEPHSALDSFVP